MEHQPTTDIQSNEPTTSIQSMQDEMKALQAELLATKEELVKVKYETAAAIKQVEAVQAQASIDIKSVQKQAAEQLALSKFGLERFSTDNDSIKFYTGFPTYQHIQDFYEFVRSAAETMTYCYASGERESRPGARTMQLIDELFMFLVRLKLGLFEKDLAHRFQICMSSISRKITTWCNFLYFFLGSQMIWPSRDDVNKFMPESFKAMYPTTRVILDCTEIFVQTPTSLLLQSQFYSSYKSSTTLKGLIGITPYGAISFVSCLYTGGISDKEITRCSGILDLLEQGDSVMADKGFDIDDLLRAKGVALNIPPFLKSQGQFTALDVQKTKTIARLRIHVERAIRRIKEYHFFDTDVPLSTLGSVNQLYTVACLLTNFQGPLILSQNNK
ncbi:uncharacterized protein [Montipora foliosa]|uniref:uncharacterized protein n=1 Tax=Montipora foliosa TaxID=591990 RepID=UPI0035F1160F